MGNPWESKSKVIFLLRLYFYYYQLFIKDHLEIPEWTKAENEEQEFKNSLEEAGFSISEWTLKERVHKFKEAGQYAGTELIYYIVLLKLLDLLF